MGAAVIAAADENGTRGGDTHHGVGDAIGSGNLRRVIRRADNDKIVVHDFPAVGGVTFCDKGILGGAGMHEDRIDITGAPQPQRLPGAHDQQLHVQPQILLDLGQQDVGQAGIVE